MSSAFHGTRPESTGLACEAVVLRSCWNSFITARICFVDRNAGAEGSVARQRFPNVREYGKTYLRNGGCGVEVCRRSIRPRFEHIYRRSASNTVGAGGDQADDFGYGAAYGVSSTGSLKRISGSSIRSGKRQHDAAEISFEWRPMGVVVIIPRAVQPCGDQSAREGDFRVQMISGQ